MNNPTVCHVTQGGQGESSQGVFVLSLTVLQMVLQKNFANVNESFAEKKFSKLNIFLFQQKTSKMGKHF